MAEIYCLGNRIKVTNRIGVTHYNEIIRGVLVGISDEPISVIDIKRDDQEFTPYPAAYYSYPISKLRGVKIKPMKLKGGIVDLCVHVDEGVLRA